MAIWPFSRAWPLGLVKNQVPTEAELNKLDEQHAQAADGQIWTDLAPFLNISEDVDAGAAFLNGGALLFDPSTDLWHTFGQAAGNTAIGLISYDGTRWINGAITAGAAVVSVKDAATDGAGTIVVGLHTSGGATKLRRRSAALAWSAPSVGVSGAETVDTVCWMPGPGLFVIGRDDTSVNNIETSPDGVIWTPRTAPNSNARAASAANASICVMVAATLTDKVLTSSDGITWVERTVPLSTTWASVTWNERQGLFMLVGGPGSVAVSPDGITWSSRPAPPSGIGAGARVRSYGRVWFVASPTGAQLVASINDGNTWQRVTSIDVTTDAFAVGRGQLMLASNNLHRRSLRVGY